MRHDAANSSDCLWQILEEHFQYHSRLVDHFRSADASAVTAMWNSGANAAGEQLSQFEYDALVERYCELFGNWPKHPQRVGSGEADNIRLAKRRLPQRHRRRGPWKLAVVR